MRRRLNSFQIKQIEECVERNRAFVGQTFGDFEIVRVEYDWENQKHVNTVRCTLCGMEKRVVSVAAFVRGKAERQYCECRKYKSVNESARSYSDCVGETVHGFKLLSYEVGKGFRVECVECGKQKWAGGKTVLNGDEKCNHRITKDYSDPAYVGARSGSLTAIERIGRKFRFRCDCGSEIICAPSEVFRDVGRRSCGDQNCGYHRDWLQQGQSARTAGIAFEFECAADLERQGFEVEMTPSTGDYGVDFFAIVGGERIAFQCKLLKKESMVRSVQEVYAGGRYYDCERFVVVSPSGFTYAAEILADKLGVQLERSVVDFCLKSLTKNRIDTRIIAGHSSRKLIWEIDGVSKPAEEWCQEYGITRSAVVTRVKRNGMDLKTALTAPHYKRTFLEIDGVVKSKQEWCDEYGISCQLYDYRTKQAGLSPIEALTKEKRR